MIVPMKKVLLVALREDKDALAQALQQVGEVMPVDAEGSPFAATESQEAARAELSELRSGPAGARILSGLEKARKLRLEHDICRKGGASVC